MKLLLDKSHFITGEKRVIEFDGAQHFTDVNTYGGEEEYKIRVIHDWIKNEFCKNKRYSLLRIRFDQITEIKNILDVFFENPERFKDETINPYLSIHDYYSIGKTIEGLSIEEFINRRK